MWPAYGTVGEKCPIARAPSRSFSRTVSLATGVVAEKAKAEFENGVVTLALPRAEEHKPKTVTVRPM